MAVLLLSPATHGTLSADHQAILDEQEKLKKTPEPVPVDLLQQAEEGNGEAQIALAQFYMRENNYDELQIYRWYLAAARLGHLEAQAMVGFLLIEGVGAPANVQAALHWLDLAAMRGDLDSQLLLGTLFLTGEKGVPRVLKRAYDYFHLAANKGSSQGQLMLAICYENGLGCTQSTEKARHWAELSAAQDNAKAYALLGDIVLKNVPRGTKTNPHISGTADAFPREAQSYYMHAAYLGDAKAAYQIAQAALASVNGEVSDSIKQSYANVMEQSAIGGYAAAVYELALCYEHGFGVEQDLEYAAELMTDAAGLQYEPARYHVMRYYAAGYGHKPSISDEYYWMNQSIK